jgi:hypothetical protein
MLRHLNLLISTLLFSLTHITLTIYDSESFGSAVGSCKLPTMCAPWLCASTHPHPSSSNCLSSRRPLFLESGSEKHTHTYVWEGQLWSLSCTGNDCLAIVLFLIVVFPLLLLSFAAAAAAAASLLIISVFFLIPLYPTLDIERTESSGTKMDTMFAKLALSLCF